MEDFSGLINLLLQHGQRFFEIWNFQIIIAIAVIGYIFSNEGLVAKNRVRIHITIVFLMIAIFSVYTLSVHHGREVALWNALQAKVAAAPGQFTAEDTAYLGTLKPTSFFLEAGALIIADLLVIAVTWMSPKVRAGS